MKNRTLKLIYQSSYISIGIVAILASLGLFQFNFRETFFVYFTNLSNYLCFAVMLFELADTARSPEDKYTSVIPTLKFASVLAIMLTFFVYNFILTPGINASKLEISSFLMHIALPLMFTLDYFLFYERGRSRWYYPLFAVLLPIVYGAFVYIRGAIHGFNPSTRSLYPYFFMNVEKLGISGVARYLSVMLASYVICGYALFIFDSITLRSNKNNSEKEKTK